MLHNLETLILQMVLKTVDLIVFHKTKTLDFKAPIQCRELYIHVNILSNLDLK